MRTRSLLVTIGVGIILFAGTTALHAQDTVVIPCDGDPVPQTYCYPNNADHTWHWESDCGSPISLQFVSGTIEASLYDHLWIFDGPDQVSPSVYANPPAPDIQDLTGLMFVGNSGHLYMRMTSNPSNCCASNGLVANDWEPWAWTVSVAGGTGVHEAQAVDFRFFPNPVADRVNWEWPGYMEGEVLVRLVDGSGRMVREERFVAFPGSMGTMSMEGLRNGLYTVVMSDPEGRVARRLQVSR